MFFIGRADAGEFFTRAAYIALVQPNRERPLGGCAVRDPPVC